MINKSQLRTNNWTGSTQRLSASYKVIKLRLHKNKVISKQQPDLGGRKYPLQGTLFRLVWNCFSEIFTLKWMHNVKILNVLTQMHVLNEWWKIHTNHMILLKAGTQNYNQYIIPHYNEEIPPIIPYFLGRLLYLLLW